MLKERVPLKVRQRIPRWAKSPVRRARDKLVHPIQNKLKYRQRLSDVPEITLGEKNVLIVTVDCLRADHTTLLNYERNTTPFIGDLGLRFPNAVSASPWTYPSVVSILTGYYPHNHGGTFSTEPRHFREGYPNAIKENVYTLSELFGRAGYSTYLSTTIYPAQLPLNGRFSKLKMWDYRTPADELISSLLRWWRSHSDKKFAYLHLGDLHEPLRLPELDQYPFGRIADISGLDGWRFTNTTEPTAKFQKYREEKIRLYDTLIHYLDGQIKRLFRGLEREGDIDDTLLIITGDHGEEFWEHAELERNHFFDPREYYGIGHGHTLFQEIINIPIIVWGVEEENTRTHRVSTADIAPTILDQLGDNTSQSNSNLPMRFDGISLEKEKKHDVVLSEETAYGYEKKAIMKEEYKLIVSEGDDVRFLFNLSEDPGEKQPLDNDDIKNRLFDLIPEQKQTGEAIDLDKDVNKRLKDLGYI